MLVFQFLKSNPMSSIIIIIIIIIIPIIIIIIYLALLFSITTYHSNLFQ